MMFLMSVSLAHPRLVVRFFQSHSANQLSGLFVRLPGISCSSSSLRSQRNALQEELWRHARIRRCDFCVQKSFSGIQKTKVLFCWTPKFFFGCKMFFGYKKIVLDI